jgi:hypothetical protein
MNRGQIITQCRSQSNLNDTGTIWTDANLNKILDDVLGDMTQQRALQREACFAITGKAIDISALSRLVKIYRVQWPVSDKGFKYDNRDYQSYGTSIKLDLSATPTIVSGTLTGTVTFTKGSQAVTGAGTLFTTELQAGYLIGFSSGTKFYVISSIESATALTLDLPFEEETAADTVSVTKYRDANSCARVYYGKEYTVSRSAVASFCSGLDDLTVNVAYSGTGEKIYIVKIDSTGSPDKFKWSGDNGLTFSAATNCATTATVLENKVTVTFGAATGHTAADYWTWVARPSDLEGIMEPVLIHGVVAYAATEWASVLSAAETSVLLPNLASTGDLTTGRTLINALNEGGDVAMKYAQYAQVDIAVAQAQVVKMREYKTWANMRMAMYQKGLNALIRLSDYVKFSCPRN